MKVSEVIQRIQSLYSKGVESDDSRLSRRHIYNKMLSVRSKLISQEAKKKQRISQWNYQTIPCVKLIKVPAHQCPCLPPIGCSVLRSEYRLPGPLTGFVDDLIQSVTSIERSVKIDRITINAVNVQKGNKYTSKKTNYFIQDGYLYITTPSKLKVVSVIGLFEDPIEVENFKGYCDESCTDCVDCGDYMENEFPLDSDMIDTLVELVVQELIILFSQNLEDLSNNTRDSLKERSK